MYNKITLTLLTVMFSIASCTPDGASYEPGIAKLINNIRQNKRDAVAATVEYPLRRRYPLPPVENKLDFIKRYDEIFDKKLINEIVNSNIHRDWGRVGWRGIMLLDGDVWVNEDAKLIAINYESPKEKELRTRLIEEEKATLHESLRIYEEPVCILETSKFKVRIDHTGSDKYRYASWPAKSSMSEKPELVIDNGTVEFAGSGGNHTFIFKNAGYIYNCAIGANDSPPAMLTVEKNGVTVLSQKASLQGE